MSRVPLYQELRLIERNESEVNGAWKGAHVLLFFLAFVFGSFCTFCFHMLMYLFDDKCVLFPKLLSLPSIKHNVIYEFEPDSKDLEFLPIDLLSPQWVDKSTCSFPTFVPLVSGICGLIWTTLFLMCSTGRRLTGCSYTINVATLLYERRIRGVYQATRLTILSAWLHTACWLLSAVLALVRVLLVVDFKLVRVSAQLHGDIDKILERHEIQIRTISPETLSRQLHERKTVSIKLSTEDLLASDYFFLADNEDDNMSENSLEPDERRHLYKNRTYEYGEKETAFVITLLYDLLDDLPLSELFLIERPMSPPSETNIASSEPMSGESRGESQKSRVDNRQLADSNSTEDVLEDSEVKEVVSRIDSLILSKYDQVRKSKDGISFRNETPEASTSKHPDKHYDSVMNITEEMQQVLDTAGEEKLKKPGPSSLKSVSVQTTTSGLHRSQSKTRLRVRISEMDLPRLRSDSTVAESDEQSSITSKEEVAKEAKPREKEKQD
uniref:Uncharacterized protein n=1 Tax=Heliothis virescens TaxID=7102 RepID=A0A2A4J214_HELVI